MPIYEYECTNCYEQFDLMQKIHDAPIKQCQKCFKDTAVRLVSAAGFQLKGTGWYVTDFKNNDKNKEKKKAVDTNTTTDAKASVTPSNDEKKIPDVATNTD